jgi:hypothetical protein
MVHFEIIWLLLCFVVALFFRASPSPFPFSSPSPFPSPFFQVFPSEVSVLGWKTETTVPLGLLVMTSMAI